VGIGGIDRANREWTDRPIDGEVSGGIARVLAEESAERLDGNQQRYQQKWSTENEIDSFCDGLVRKPGKSQEVRISEVCTSTLFGPVSMPR